MSRTEKIEIRYGIVELKKVKTWGERREACSISRPEFSLPVLYQMIKNERDWLKQNKEGKIKK